MDNEKNYLLLLDFYNLRGELRQYHQFIHGRDEVFSEILDMCMVYKSEDFKLSFEDSKILVDGIYISEAQPLRKFINLCVSYKYINNDTLDALLENGYLPTANTRKEHEDLFVNEIPTVNNEKVNNFIMNDDIIKEEI